MTVCTKIPTWVMGQRALSYQKSDPFDPLTHDPSTHCLICRVQLPTFVLTGTYTIIHSVAYIAVKNRQKSSLKLQYRTRILRVFVSLARYRMFTLLCRGSVCEMVTSCKVRVFVVSDAVRRRVWMSGWWWSCGTKACSGTS